MARKIAKADKLKINQPKNGAISDLNDAKDLPQSKKEQQKQTQHQQLNHKKQLTITISDNPSLINSNATFFNNNKQYLKHQEIQNGDDASSQMPFNSKGFGSPYSQLPPNNNASAMNYDHNTGKGKQISQADTSLTEKTSPPQTVSGYKFLNIKDEEQILIEKQSNQFLYQQIAYQEMSPLLQIGQGSPPLSKEGHSKLSHITSSNQKQARPFPVVVKVNNESSYKVSPIQRHIIKSFGENNTYARNSPQIPKGASQQESHLIQDRTQAQTFMMQHRSNNSVLQNAPRQSQSSHPPPPVQKSQKSPQQDPQVMLNESSIAIANQGNLKKMSTDAGHTIQVNQGQAYFQKQSSTPRTQEGEKLERQNWSNKISPFHQKQFLEHTESQDQESEGIAKLVGEASLAISGEGEEGPGLVRYERRGGDDDYLVINFNGLKKKSQGLSQTKQNGNASQFSRQKYNQTTALRSIGMSSMINEGEIQSDYRSNDSLKIEDTSQPQFNLKESNKDFIHNDKHRGQLSHLYQGGGQSQMSSQQSKSQQRNTFSIGGSSIQQNQGSLIKQGTSTTESQMNYDYEIFQVPKHSNNSETIYQRDKAASNFNKQQVLANMIKKSNELQKLYTNQSSNLEIEGKFHKNNTATGASMTSANSNLIRLDQSFNPSYPNASSTFHQQATSNNSHMQSLISPNQLHSLYQQAKLTGIKKSRKDKLRNLITYTGQPVSEESVTSPLLFTQNARVNAATGGKQDGFLPQLTQNQQNQINQRENQYSQLTHISKLKNFLNIQTNLAQAAAKAQNQNNFVAHNGASTDKSMLRKSMNFSSIKGQGEMGNQRYQAASMGATLSEIQRGDPQMITYSNGGNNFQVGSHLQQQHHQMTLAAAIALQHQQQQSPLISKIGDKTKSRDMLGAHPHNGNFQPNKNYFSHLRQGQSVKTQQISPRQPGQSQILQQPNSQSQKPMLSKNQIMRDFINQNYNNDAFPDNQTETMNVAQWTQETPIEKQREEMMRLSQYIKHKVYERVSPHQQAFANTMLLKRNENQQHHNSSSDYTPKSQVQGVIAQQERTVSLRNKHQTQNFSALMSIEDQFNVKGQTFNHNNTKDSRQPAPLNQLASQQQALSLSFKDLQPNQGVLNQPGYQNQTQHLMQHPQQHHQFQMNPNSPLLPPKASPHGIKGFSQTYSSKASKEMKTPRLYYDLTKRILTSDATLRFDRQKLPTLVFVLEGALISFLEQKQFQINIRANTVNLLCQLSHRHRLVLISSWKQKRVKQVCIFFQQLKEGLVFDAVYKVQKTQNLKSGEVNFDYTQILIDFGFENLTQKILQEFILVNCNNDEDFDAASIKQKGTKRLQIYGCFNFSNDKLSIHDKLPIQITVPNLRLTPQIPFDKIFEAILKLSSLPFPHKQSPNMNHHNLRIQGYSQQMIVHQLPHFHSHSQPHQPQAQSHHQSHFSPRDQLHNQSVLTQQNLSLHSPHQVHKHCDFTANFKQLKKADSIQSGMVFKSFKQGLHPTNALSQELYKLKVDLQKLLSRKNLVVGINQMTSGSGKDQNESASTSNSSHNNSTLSSSQNQVLNQKKLSQLAVLGLSLGMNMSSLTGQNNLATGSNSTYAASMRQPVLKTDGELYYNTYNELFMHNSTTKQQILKYLAEYYKDKPNNKLSGDLEREMIGKEKGTDSFSMPNNGNMIASSNFGFAGSELIGISNSSGRRAANLEGKISASAFSAKIDELVAREKYIRDQMHKLTYKHRYVFIVPTEMRGVNPTEVYVFLEDKKKPRVMDLIAVKQKQIPQTVPPNPNAAKALVFEIPEPCLMISQSNNKGGGKSNNKDKDKDPTMISL